MSVVGELGFGHGVRAIGLIFYPTRTYRASGRRVALCWGI